MKRRLGALFAALAVMLTFAPVVFAGDQFTGCTENQWINDANKFILYENVSGDLQDGNDQLYGCNDLSNLASIPHNPPGTCKGLLSGQSNWNDCVSSWYVKVQAGQVFCTFPQTGYNGLTSNADARVGPFTGRVNSGADVVSSVGFTPGTHIVDCYAMND
jgi:hypothetical protein